MLSAIQLNQIRPNTLNKFFSSMKMQMTLFLSLIIGLFTHLLHMFIHNIISLFSQVTIVYTITGVLGYRYYLRWIWILIKSKTYYYFKMYRQDYWKKYIVCVLNGTTVVLFLSLYISSIFQKFPNEHMILIFGIQKYFIL